MYLEISWHRTRRVSTTRYSEQLNSGGGAGMRVKKIRERFFM
jgi:hypothetical protein